MKKSKVINGLKGAFRIAGLLHFISLSDYQIIKLP